MSEKHLSSQFDAELNMVTSQVMEMGGLVEQQMAQAVEALLEHNLEAARVVEQNEPRVNEMEVVIDHEMTSIISRRQPTARDLRLLIATARITANLERAGDEANRIARNVQKVLSHGNAHRVLPTSELRIAAQMASDLLRRSLDAFARLDTRIAVEILKADTLIDVEYEGYLRKLVTYMMEDPRTIGVSLELMTVAKALERIGDHSKNIAECVIYIVQGLDVRHSSVEDIEDKLV